MVGGEEKRKKVRLVVHGEGKNDRGRTYDTSICVCVCVWAHTSGCVSVCIL